jgi:hypothetical protein
MTTEKLYSNHLGQQVRSLPPADRSKELSEALGGAFRRHIIERVVGYIQFDQVSVEELADAFFRYPILIKSVLASVNVASRAVARDLEISLDTYNGGSATTAY